MENNWLKGGKGKKEMKEAQMDNNMCPSFLNSYSETHRSLYKLVFTQGELNTMSNASADTSAQ